MKTPLGIGGTHLSHMHRPHYIGPFYRSIILCRTRLGLPIKVVCPIREPVDRSVSTFFFNCPDLIAKADLEEVKELFLTYSKPGNPIRLRGYNPERFLNWFDREFRPVTQIDVYKKPFPTDSKYQVYRRGFTQVLVYRNDLKRSEQAKLISRFLGIKLDEMGSENAAKNTDYAELYSRFRESVKLPEWYIEQMHDSRFAKHFWSPAELKLAADKWRVAPSS